MVLGQREDREPLGCVFLEPCSQLRRRGAIAGNQLCQGRFSLGERAGIPHGAQLGSDALAGLDVGYSTGC